MKKKILLFTFPLFALSLSACSNSGSVTNSSSNQSEDDLNAIHVGDYRRYDVALTYGSTVAGPFHTFSSERKGVDGDDFYISNVSLTQGYDTSQHDDYILISYDVDTPVWFLTVTGVLAYFHFACNFQTAEEETTIDIGGDYIKLFAKQIGHETYSALQNSYIDAIYVTWKLRY